MAGNHFSTQFKRYANHYFREKMKTSNLKMDGKIKNNLEGN